VNRLVKPEEGVSTEDFKAAMASFAAGVTIVTTLDRSGRPAALTATAFSSLSATPPLCLVCVDKRASAHGPIREQGRFAVNILSAAQAALSSKFATRSADKFADVAWQPGPLTGCPIIEGALSRVECELVEVYDGGDHDIFVGRLLSVEVSDGKPLVYWRGDYASLRAAARRDDAQP
jgi:flavin reductase (DIM6/NTAB) family NADH-FMN oxidoreductase RutF